MKPLVIDLFCGLGGWSKGFIAEGYRAVGFDVERHDYGAGGYPGDLVLQDVLTLHGSQFRDATCIVSSPPCQRYSYMAMPWKRSRAIIAWHKESPERIQDLNALFDACFRIQLEASKAAGRYIPMVVENVKGAQPWVGRAKAHYGSYYLWGDVEDVGGRIVASGPVRFGMPSVKALKVVKVASESGRRTDVGNGVRFTSRDCGVEHQKQPGWFNDDKRSAKCGGDWFSSGENCSLMRSMSSKPNARKAASAAIAEIPFELSSHIARIFRPT